MKDKKQSFNKHEENLNIHEVSYSFYEFAKNYIKIKDKENEHSFNDVELKELVEMQQMMDKGYELRLVRLRGGSKLIWCMKN